MTKAPIRKMELPGGRGEYSQQGALFANHILALGREGFADWLLRSFGGANPTPAPGWFHYDYDMLFSEAFTIVVNEFEDDVIRVASAAVEKAIADFRPERGTYVGLYVLSALAEELRSFNIVPKVANIVGTWLPHDSIDATRPKTRDDVVSLRETLECVYRLLLITLHNFQADDEVLTPVNADELKNFALMCSWADYVLRHQHNLRALLPARAPIYFFALTQATVFDKTKITDPYDYRMLNGAYVNGDLFKDLYEFSSQKSPDYKFPYNVDKIIDEKEAFVDLLERKRAYRPRSIVEYENPFDVVIPSATRGVFLPPGSPDEYLEIICSLDDEATEDV
jgi:hypothetical protein